MATKGLILLLVVAASCANSYENVDDSDHEAVLMEVSASIASMKKKGATAADCKDLAKTTCKEVENERSTDQKLINRLRTGHHCVNKGQAGVRRATAHWQKTKKTLNAWKLKVTQSLNSIVSFSSRSFRSMKPGHCGFIFGSSSYVKAKARYSHTVRVYASWKGRVSEAYKMVVRMKYVAKKMVHKCYCATKSAYYKVVRTVTSTRRLARQNQAHAKCKMMACVLNGTKLTSKKCKGSLKKLVMKKLYSTCAKTRCLKEKKTVKKSTSSLLRGKAHVYNNVDFMGADIRSLRSHGLRDCYNHCKRQRGCLAFTMRKSDKYCWLKKKYNGARKLLNRRHLISANMVKK